MRNRSQVLAENLMKWGNPGVIVTNNDPADFTELGPLFDVILTDVPVRVKECSARMKWPCRNGA